MNTPRNPSARNAKIGVLAISAVALAATGGAYAASKLHGSADAAKSGLSTGWYVSSKTAATHMGGGPGHGFGMRGGMRHGPGDELAAAATYLGVSQDTLMSSLQSGKTLAQVANTTSGKSAAGLVDALVAAEKDEIAAAVKAGNLTQAQADQITANLKDRVTNLVNGVRPMHPDGPPPSAGWGGNGMRANHI